jgi:RNA polymerase sigma-70 factor (ECF subfamily)
MVVLTEDQRDIVVRRFVLDQSLEDVAATTGRTVGAVKSMQRRALETLRRALRPKRVA